MSNQPYNATFKLNKFFLFSDSNYLMHFIYAHLFFGIVPMICLAFFKDSPWHFYFLVILIVNLILYFAFRYEYPSYLTITDDKKIIFDKRYEEIGIWGRSHLAQATITLSFIEDIKIIQNHFERLFGMCHVCLYGSPNMKITSGSIIPKYQYVFYGMNYKKAKMAFENAFSKEQWN